MSFTPESVADYTAIKTAKKTAAAHIADNFFTYAFAFALCALPCFFLYIIGKALSILAGLKIMIYVLPPLAAFPLFYGYATFARELYTTGKRNFFTICEKAFEKPLLKIRNGSIALFISACPPLVIYFLPFALGGGRGFHMVCEILSLAAAVLAVCVFTSYAVFSRIRLRYLRFSSSFLFQIALTALTKGVWLVIFIPHLLLSALIYSKTN